MAQIRKLLRSATIDCIVVERHTRHEQGNTARRVILQRCGQDRSGYWHSLPHFMPSDIPELIGLLSLVHRTLTGGEPKTGHHRPVDLDLSALDFPDIRELHDAIIASQIRR